MGRLVHRTYGMGLYGQYLGVYMFVEHKRAV